jgi:hypothetical protein
MLALDTINNNNKEIIISEGRFCGTDFWVEVKKWPACPYAVPSQEMSKVPMKCNGTSGK